MGAPSPWPVIPSRAYATCRVSRYWLDDMVVVQVCDLGRRVRARDRGLCEARHRRRGCSLHEASAVHFTLLMATSSLVQRGSFKSSIRTMGVCAVVALMNLPPPRYTPVWVMCLSELPKYNKSPGARSFRSTGATPLQSACGWASRGMFTPRRRQSIWANPEQS